MKRALLIAIWTFCAQGNAADIVSSERLYPWAAGVTVGVHGGIQNRTTIFTNMTGLDNTGATDVSAALDAALTACPSNQVVYLPAGTFRVDSVISLSDSDDGVTLRGAGLGVTIIKSYVPSGYATIEWGTTDWPIPVPSHAITSGADANSSNVVVASTAGIAIGNMVRIGQTSPDYVFTTGSATNLQHSMHLVSATNATDVTLWPPLPLTLTNSPTISVYTKVVRGSSVEDLTFDLSNADVASIYALQWWGGWIENVEVTGSDTRQMWFNTFNAGEIRECYTHGTRSSGPGHEGIDFYGACCWNLVENNTSSNGGFPGIILGDGVGGCVGNVVAFNWVDSIDSGSTVAGAAFSVNHAPHNMFNLFEGNVGQMFQSDGYFGSASHNTVFRNYLSGTYTTNIVWQRSIDLCRWSYFFNAAANVLGTTNQTFTYSTTNNGFNSPLIYRFGFPNMGNMAYTGSNPPTTNWAGLDAKVEETVVLVANYDYATSGIVNPTNDIPTSYYRSSAPSFMAGYNWPAIGSDLTPMVSRIPAQDRFTQRRATAGTVNVGTLTIAP